ncbi:hypothetical protein [Cupriavidus campinensis]|uniref:Uncharacterized protein n=1 Tax=Cupriavidus campinensis TaxID=151783 RepID=A0ABY3EI87_9BURK|nr:hypothetical protein [Cupriavidus campinensis]TSP10649.1 hypothetical protein FGG12_21385 [Cupriavidus campinensis]
MFSTPDGFAPVGPLMLGRGGAVELGIGVLGVGLARPAGGQGEGGVMLGFRKTAEVAMTDFNSRADCEAYEKEHGLLAMRDLITHQRLSEQRARVVQAYIADRDQEDAAVMQSRQTVASERQADNGWEQNKIAWIALFVSALSLIVSIVM